MIDFKKYTDKLQSRLKPIAQARKRKLLKVQAEFKKLEDQVQEEFSGRAASEMYSALQRDYMTLEITGGISDATPEEIEKAKQIIQIKRTVESIADEKAKSAMEAVIPLLASTEGVKKAVDYLGSNFKPSGDITSYIAATRTTVALENEGKKEEKDIGRVCLVSPLKQKNKGLAKSLDEKIFAILSEEEVGDGSMPDYDTKAGVQSVGSTIKFSANSESANEFTVYTLLTDNPASANKLAACIAKKLEELQPDGFDKTKLKHKVQVLPDFGVMDYFMKHGKGGLCSSIELLESMKSEGKTELSYEEAAKVLERTRKGIKGLVSKGHLQSPREGYVGLDSMLGSAYHRRGVRALQVQAPEQENPQQPGSSTGISQITPREAGTRMNYSSTTPEEIRHEALARLASLGKEKVDSNELKYVMGAGSNSYPTLFARHSDVAPNVTKENGRLYFSTDAVKKYIETRTPGKNGWLGSDSKSKKTGE